MVSDTVTPCDRDQVVLDNPNLTAAATTSLMVSEEEECTRLVNQQESSQVGAIFLEEEGRKIKFFIQKDLELHIVEKLHYQIIVRV